MKRLLCGCLAVTAFVLAGARGFASAPEESTKEDVIAVDRVWARAHQSCDVALMRTTLADDLLFVHTNGDIDDRDQELKRLTCTRETRPEVLSVRVYGDTAVLVGKLHIVRKEGAGPTSVVYTRVYVRRQGAWRMVSHHATDLPTR